MRRIRVIPVLLLHNRGLVKSVKFKNYKYVGDPINAVRIFNEKEVDEICILDITATKQKRGPDQEHIAEIVSEAFMPLSYGGGVADLEHAEKLFYNGFTDLHTKCYEDVLSGGGFGLSEVRPVIELVHDIRGAAGSFPRR